MVRVSTETVAEFYGRFVALLASCETVLADPEGMHREDELIGLMADLADLDPEADDFIPSGAAPITLTQEARRYVERTSRAYYARLDELHSGWWFACVEAQEVIERVQ